MAEKATTPPLPKIIALHASACVTPGGALLFLGHGGAGKSTAVGLLAERFPTLADDAVFLLPQADGSWQVACGDRDAFAGPVAEEAAAGLSWAPLRAVLRLFRAPELRLAPIGPRKTCRHLADGLFEIPPQRNVGVEVKRHLFVAAAEVARSIPGWELYFRPDRSTSELLMHRFA
jgi:hypothetical protein